MYYILKLLHALPAIVFLANIFIGMFWMVFAVKSNDQRLIHFAIKSINRLDKYLTVPSVILLVVFGFILMFKVGYSFLNTPLILCSSVLILISGLIFGIKLTPLQIKFEKLVEKKDFNKSEFDKIYKYWLVWGTLALLTPVIALMMMLLKIPN